MGYDFIHDAISNVVITTKDKTFKNINRRSYKDTSHNSMSLPFYNIDRCDAYDISPYDETILIDADYLIMSDVLNNCWGHDNKLMMNWKYQDIMTDRDDPTLRRLSPFGITMYWATVVYFKKGTHAKMIFDTWRSVYKNYAFYSELFGFNKAPFRNDYAMSIAHQMCNGYSNTQTFDYALPALASSDSILDYVDGRWILKYQYKNSYNALRYTGDLHVMNKKSLLDADTDVYTKLWNSIG